MIERPRVEELGVTNVFSDRQYAKLLVEGDFLGALARSYLVNSVLGCC